MKIPRPFLNRPFHLGLLSLAILIITATSARADLSTALNATNLVWATSGDTDWVVEKTNSVDLVSAAQCGVVTNFQTSVLSTTVTGPGTLSFYWKTAANDPNFDLEFDLDGNDFDDNDISSGGFWLKETTFLIAAGQHTLTWTAFANGSTNLNNVAWVDDVEFAPLTNAPVTLHFQMEIQRYQDLNSGYTNYVAFPNIDFISPIALTTNRVESPDGQSYSEVWAGGSSQDAGNGERFSSLDEMIFACTNGLWKIYVNKGAPNEQVFHFQASISGLTTNQLSAVTVFTPTKGAVNVPINASFQWSGPTNFSSVFVEADQTSPGFIQDGYRILPGDATNWPSPPTLVYGTNNLFLSYTLDDFSNITFSMPVDSGLRPMASWTTLTGLESDAFLTFVVGAPAPLPVQLGAASVQSGGGNFQLSFQTVAGRPEIVQVRTNLMTGAWAEVTNFIGDGSAHQFNLPTTNAVGEFFRVVTQ